MIAQSPADGVEATVVVDDQQGSGLFARLKHGIGFGKCAGDGFFDHRYSNADQRLRFL